MKPFTFTNVLDVIATTRSTIPAGQAQGAAIMQADIIRHLREAFGPGRPSLDSFKGWPDHIPERPGFEPGCCHKTVLVRCTGCPYDNKDQ